MLVVITGYTYFNPTMIGGILTKYLERKEIRDKIKFFNGMIDTCQNELRREESDYYLKRAKHFQELADSYQAKADDMRQRHTDLVEHKDKTIEKMNNYRSQRAKWIFLNSKAGKGIYDILVKVKPQFHDKVLTALLSAATSDSGSQDMNCVLREIFEKGE